MPYWKNLWQALTGRKEALPMTPPPVQVRPVGATPSHTRRSVSCAECEWTGTIQQSLSGNAEDDQCPECGSSVLCYDI